MNNTDYSNSEGERLDEIRSRLEWFRKYDDLNGMRNYLQELGASLTEDDMNTLGFFNSLTAQDDDDGGKRRDSAESPTSPFARIPNVSTFKVNVGLLEPLFAKFGIRKKEQPDFT